MAEGDSEEVLAEAALVAEGSEAADLAALAAGAQAVAELAAVGSLQSSRDE